MIGSSKIKKVFPAAVFLLVLFAVSSCKDPLSPGVEYMPDMYRTSAVKAYVNYDYPDSITARMPVEGTIPYAAEPEERYNKMPYPFPNTPEGYEAAGVNIKSTVEETEENLAEGKRLYTNYCMMCHGEQGKGDGILVQREKFPPPPSYSGQLKDLPEGKMFHSVTFGKGLMGPHASLLSKTERWKIIQYVKQLQKIE